MPRTTLAALESARAHRPAGYVDAILAAGRVDPDGVHHHIDRETLEQIRRGFLSATSTEACDPSRTTVEQDHATRTRPLRSPLFATAGARRGPGRGVSSSANEGEGASPPNPPPLPGLGQQLKNATTAAFRLARQTLQGKAALAAPEVVAARLALCRSCPEYRAQDQRCARCGCRLAGAVISKTRLATEACPLGKWPVTATFPTQNPD